MQIEVL